MTTLNPTHVMMPIVPYCARCGDAMAFLESQRPPAFSARAFCQRCNYAVRVKAIVLNGEAATVDAV